MIDAYPLTWPPGWRRIEPHRRTDAKFNVGGSGRQSTRRVELADGLKRVYRELGAMGVRESDIVVSSMLRLRLDGQPFRDQATAKLDPGIAVYWTERHPHRERCIAIDRYIRMADNLAAIAATLDAMRAIERHGGAEILERAFTGFTALPAPEQPWQVLGVRHDATRDEIDQAFRRLAMDAHPDRGGDQERMARINTARDAALERACA